MKTKIVKPGYNVTETAAVAASTHWTCATPERKEAVRLEVKDAGRTVPWVFGDANMVPLWQLLWYATNTGPTSLNWPTNFVRDLHQLMHPGKQKWIGPARPILAAAKRDAAAARVLFPETDGNDKPVCYESVMKFSGRAKISLKLDVSSGRIKRVDGKHHPALFNPGEIVRAYRQPEPLPPNPMMREAMVLWRTLLFRDERSGDTKFSGTVPGSIFNYCREHGIQRVKLLIGGLQLLKDKHADDPDLTVKKQLSGLCFLHFPVVWPVVSIFLDSLVCQDCQSTGSRRYNRWDVIPMGGAKYRVQCPHCGGARGMTLQDLRDRWDAAWLLFPTDKKNRLPKRAFEKLMGLIARESRKGLGWFARITPSECARRMGITRQNFHLRFHRCFNNWPEFLAELRVLVRLRHLLGQQMRAEEIMPAFPNTICAITDGFFGAKGWENMAGPL